jgi:hypothetical protein
MQKMNIIGLLYLRNIHCQRLEALLDPLLGDDFAVGGAANGTPHFLRAREA